MSAKVHRMKYRPLIGGIEIKNPNVAAPGTLGFVATDDNDQRWLVSCFHVLHSTEQPAAADNQAIYQPTTEDNDNIVAYTDSNYASAELDCAAGRLVDGISGNCEILGIGTIGEAEAPSLGMRVLKAGRSTGVTEGWITNIDGENIRIEILPGFPRDYQLCDKGDSGALWLERDTRRPVGLLTGGTETGRPISFAVALAAVLEELSLRILTGA